MSDSFVLPTKGKETTAPDTSKWPLLLKDYDKLNIRTGCYSPLGTGYNPMARPIREHLKYGCLNLDKPSNPSSHEVVSWVKRILNPLGVEKTGHAGTLDPDVSGCLIICTDRATRLVKSQQGAGKEYVTILQLNNAPPGGLEQLKETVASLVGPVFQRPPEVSAVKKELRIRHVYESELLEWDEKSKMAVIRVACEAGTYIRTLCIHIGLLLGVEGKMFELRRTKSGLLSEKDHLVTMHDLLDAVHMAHRHHDEGYLRHVIKPCELLLVNHKRLVVKDTAVSSVCFGGQLFLPGLLRYESGIEKGQEIVIMTTKGEAVAIGYAVMSSDEIAKDEFGVVAKTKRVIMDRDTYPRCWGKGALAKFKKALIKKNKLDKYGRPNDNTPQIWNKHYKDYSGNEWAKQQDIDVASVNAEDLLTIPENRFNPEYAPVSGSNKASSNNKKPGKDKKPKDAPAGGDDSSSSSDSSSGSDSDSSSSSDSSDNDDKPPKKKAKKRSRKEASSSSSDSSDSSDTEDNRPSKKKRTK